MFLQGNLVDVLGKNSKKKEKFSGNVFYLNGESLIFGILVKKCAFFITLISPCSIHGCIFYSQFSQVSLSSHIDHYDTLWMFSSLWFA
jgi:hypothetical protein